MKSTTTRLELEAAALSLQFRDVLISMRNARQEHEKLALLGRIEKLLVNAVDRLRGARKDRTTRARVRPQSETPWSIAQKKSGPKPRQARTAKVNSQETANNYDNSTRKSIGAQ